MGKPEAFVVIRKHAVISRALAAHVAEDRGRFSSGVPVGWRRPMRAWLADVRRDARRRPGPNPRLFIEVLMFGPPAGSGARELFAWSDAAYGWLLSRLPAVINRGLHDHPRPHVHALVVALNVQTGRGGWPAVAHVFGRGTGRGALVALQRDYAEHVGLPRPRRWPMELQRAC